MPRSQNELALPRADLCAVMPPHAWPLLHADGSFAAFHHVTLQKKLFLEADKMQPLNLELPSSKAMR